MLKIFTVYDLKSRTYMKPFFATNTIEAMRSWMEICKDTNTQFYKYPDDFALFELGEFDPNNATFKLSQPHHLSDVVREKPLNVAQIHSDQHAAIQ